jgi:hypothetical protein
MAKATKVNDSKKPFAFVKLNRAAGLTKAKVDGGKCSFSLSQTQQIQPMAQKQKLPTT